MELNKNISEIERKFNIAGSIPLVSILSGQVRYMAGIVQTVAGVSFSLLGYVAQLVRPKEQKWAGVTRMGVEHMLHGPMNVMRGLGEALIGATLIFPVALGISQIPSGFKPIVPYELPQA